MFVFFFFKQKTAYEMRESDQVLIVVLVAQPSPGMANTSANHYHKSRLIGRIFQQCAIFLKCADTTKGHEISERRFEMNSEERLNAQSDFLTLSQVARGTHPG